MQGNLKKERNITCGVVDSNSVNIFYLAEPKSMLNVNAELLIHQFI